MKRRLRLFHLFFFFSSRRRHTRCSRDWSSDVCSSDLELEPRHIFGGDTEPARRLRAIVDPRRLAPQAELEIERRMRAARLPLVLVPQFVLAYDIITAREGTEGRPYEFHELAAWRRPWGVIPATRFARAIEQRYGVSRASADRLERVTARRAAPPAIARQAAVVAVAHGRLALRSEEHTSELQSRLHLVCRLLLEKKKKNKS